MSEPLKPLGEPHYYRPPDNDDIDSHFMRVYHRCDELLAEVNILREHKDLLEAKDRWLEERIAKLEYLLGGDRLKPGPGRCPVIVNGEPCVDLIGHDGKHTWRKPE